MKPETAEWVAKAEADFLSAGRESRVRKLPNFDLACFLAQQCAEKYLKARLCEAGEKFPKTHDLDVLLNLVLPLEPLWAVIRKQAADLTDYAVHFRYPGSSATQAQARQAIKDCVYLRSVVRTGLGFSDSNSKKKRRHTPSMMRSRRTKRKR